MQTIMHQVSIRSIELQHRQEIVELILEIAKEYQHSQEITFLGKVLNQEKAPDPMMKNMSLSQLYFGFPFQSYLSSSLLLLSKRQQEVALSIAPILWHYLKRLKQTQLEAAMISFITMTTFTNYAKISEAAESAPSLDFARMASLNYASMGMSRKEASALRTSRYRDQQTT